MNRLLTCLTHEVLDKQCLTKSTLRANQNSVLRCSAYKASPNDEIYVVIYNRELAMQMRTVYALCSHT